MNQQELHEKIKNLHCLECGNPEFYVEIIEKKDKFVVRMLCKFCGQKKTFSEDNDETHWHARECPLTRLYKPNIDLHHPTLIKANWHD